MISSSGHQHSRSIKRFSGLIAAHSQLGFILHISLIFQVQLSRFDSPRSSALLPSHDSREAFAPNASSKRAMSAWWCWIARWRGVTDSPDSALGFAPLCNRQVTPYRRPCAQHRWRGVSPFTSHTWIDVPCDNSSGNNFSDSGELAAQCNAVIPLVSASDRSWEKFPSSIICETATSSPRRTASISDLKKSIIGGLFLSYRNGLFENTPIFFRLPSSSVSYDCSVMPAVNYRSDRSEGEIWILWWLIPALVQVLESWIQDPGRMESGQRIIKVPACDFCDRSRFAWFSFFCGAHLICFCAQYVSRINC